MLEIICVDCKAIITDNDNYYMYDGDTICEDCRDNYYVYCGDCGALVYHDDAQTVYRQDSQQHVCPECSHDYTYCEHCEEYVADDEIYINTFRLTICDYCYNDCYFTCADCGIVYHTGDNFYINGDYYCGDCADDNHNNIIHSYNYRPDPVFYGNHTAGGYYGIEIEIDDGDDRQSAADDIDDAGDGHIYLKEDGSLSYKGMEIVTNPATLDYHINNFPWADICSAALNYGYRSHDTDTCGLHIHASRSLFGNTEIERDLTIAKIMLLVDFWYDTKIVNFARRDISKMRRWANKPDADIRQDDDDYDAIQKSKDSSRGDRYKAINICNYSTVEFRFFRGTLKKKYDNSFYTMDRYNYPILPQHATKRPMVHLLG